MEKIKTPYNIICFIFTLLLLTSCGLNAHLDKKNKPEGFVRQFSTSDTTFSSFVKKFEDHAKIKTGNMNYQVNDIPINFGDTEDERFVGVCFTYSDGKREIIIKADWWNRSSQSSRESLIFHELGHCALDRDHNDETITNTQGQTLRSSIMHPSIVSSANYSEYYDGYIHELFTFDNGILSSMFN